MPEHYLSFGTKKVLVKTGWEKGSLTSYREDWKEIEPDYIAEDLVDAVDLRRYYKYSLSLFNKRVRLLKI